MTVADARSLVQQFGSTMDFNETMIIVAGLSMELKVGASGDTWVAWLVGKDGSASGTGDNPLDATRSALRRYFA
ncbi:MAG: hypothetical protein ACOC9Y_03110 [Chloroflexota bacterium]